MRRDDWLRAARKRGRWARRRISAAPAQTPDGHRRVNRYGGRLTDEQISAGRHRESVGGAWHEIGRLQHGYLLATGLKPSSYLLDVGCGALRGGVHFVRYLEPGHYYGIDVNESLLRAALVKELPEAGLADRSAPGEPAGDLALRVRLRGPLRHGARGVGVHPPAAQPHPLVPVPGRQGGRARWPVLRDVLPGRPGRAFDRPVRQKATRTFPERDPYHYLPSDLAWAATSVGTVGAEAGRRLGPPPGPAHDRVRQASGRVTAAS